MIDSRDTLGTFGLSSDRIHSLAVLILTCLAAGLRFFRLGTWSFWGDEMITVLRAQDLWQLSPGRWSTSLVLSNLALQTLGASEWSARLVPAIAGILTIPLFYVFARVLAGPTEGVLAAGLLAISPWHLYWSQNARFYSTLLLFVLLAALTFYLGLERDRPALMVLSALFMGLAILERMLALIFIPVAGIYLAALYTRWFSRPAGLRLRNLAWFAAPAVVPAVYIAANLPAIRNPQVWSGLFGWVNTSPYWILAGVVFYLTVPTFCVAVASGIYLIKRSSRAGLFTLLLAVIPLLSVMVLSLIQYAANRYVFVSLVGWLLLAAIGAVELGRSAGRWGHRWLAVGALAALVLVPLSDNILYYEYQSGNRDNWKAAFAFVENNMEVGDLVVSADRQIGNYYLGQGTLGMAALELEPLLSTGSRIWFVEDFNVVQKWPWIHDWLADNARLMANFDVHVQAREFTMNVYLYDPDPSLGSSNAGRGP